VRSSPLKRSGMDHTGFTSVVVLETMVLVSSGLEAKSAGLNGLGLGLELSGLCLGLGLDTYGLGLGLGL